MPQPFFNLALLLAKGRNQIEAQIRSMLKLIMLICSAGETNNSTVISTYLFLTLGYGNFQTYDKRRV